MKKEFILVVEDDDGFRKTLYDILQVKGYSTVGVSTGQDALVKAEGVSGVALIDLNLPDMSGLSVLKELKKRLSPIECIMLTGHATQQSAIEAVNEGAYGYLQKPCDIDQLLVMIQRAEEKRRSEQTLRESEERFRSLAQMSPVGIFRTDTEGDCSYVNERWCEIAGLTAEEAHGKGWEGGLHPGDREMTSEAWYRSAREGSPFELEYRFQTQDKKTAWVYGQAVKEVDALGKTAGYIGTITDISVSKRQELHLVALQMIRDAIWEMESSNDIAKVVVAVKNALKRLDFPACKCGVNVVETGADRPEVRYFTVLPDGEIEEITVSSSVSPGTALVVDFWHGQQMVYRRNLDVEDPYGERAWFPGGCCILDVPFSHGTLALSSEIPDAFSSQDTENLQDIAHVLSEGFRRLDDLRNLEQRNLKLEDEITERKRIEKVLHREYEIRAAEDSLRIAIASMDHPTGLGQVAKEIGSQLRLLGVIHDSLSIQVVNSAGTDFVSVSYGDTAAIDTTLSLLAEPSPTSDNAEAYPWVLEVWKTGKSRYVGSTSLVGSAEKPSVFGLSLIDVPFSKGTLAINRKQCDAFTSKDVALLERFAGILSEGFQRFLDITKRIKTEENLRVKQHLNELLLDSLPHPAMLITKDRRVKALNRMVSELGVVVGDYCWKEFGKSEYISKDDKERAQRGDIKGVMCTFCKANESLKGQCMENDPEVSAFGKIWDTYWVAIDDNTYLHYAIDITDRRRMEQALIQAERYRAASELSAGMCHNLNNILSGIAAPAQMLKRMTRDPLSLQDIESIISSSNRAADLVHLLHLSIRGQTRESIYPIDLNESIEQTLQLTRHRWKDQPSVRGADINLRIELGEVLAICGTESGIQEVIANLIFNAVDAMPEGGEIIVQTQVEDDFVKLSFSDTGIGMDDEMSRKVFEPFFTTKTDIGAGLGLSSLHGMLTHWGGKAEVESTLGKGSTFILYFPVWHEE